MRGPMSESLPTPQPTVAEAIARAWSSGLRLRLEPQHVAFLAGVHTWCRHAEDPALDEDRLREIHRVVDEVAHADPLSAAQRATHAIGELREQRLLARVDTGGMARRAEYALTQLAKGIVEFLIDQDRLDRQSLTILTTRIRADLAEVRGAAERGGNAEHWRNHVEGPLRLTVGGLVEGIDRRQRGMDLDQERVRERIAASLEEGWFDAIATCEALLDSTRDAIVELHHTAMQEVQGIHQLLLEVRDLATMADQHGAIAAVDAVQAQMERVTGWCSTRLAAWSEYHQTVHGFIRGWVRMDRDRAVSQRLRDAIRSYGERPWHLRVPDAPPYRHLREPEVTAARGRVERRRTETRVPIEAGVVEVALADTLRALVAERLGETGEACLTSLLADLLPERDADGRHRLVGELVEALARGGVPAPARAGDWVASVDTLEVQELRVVAEAGDGRDN